MGREYDSARMALANIDSKREIPVISKSSTAYSGFHQGSGETTVAELLRVDCPNTVLSSSTKLSLLYIRGRRLSEIWQNDAASWSFKSSLLRIRHTYLRNCP